MPSGRHSYRPGRPIIDEHNYADQPVLGTRAAAAAATPGQGGQSRPNAGRKASEAVNLNHLLNFSMPPRRPEGRDAVPRRSKGTRNAAYLKERGSPWDLHTQDVAHSSRPYNRIRERPIPVRDEADGKLRCPSRRSRPIFCYPCILHYFQLSDIPKTAKCPICGDVIQERMLKAVRWGDSIAPPLEGFTTTFSDADSARDPQSTTTTDDVHTDHDPVTGTLDLDSSASATTGGGTTSHSSSSHHSLEMRLIFRPSSINLALPRSPSWPSEAINPTTRNTPWHFIPHVMAYAKFMLATSTYMLAELSRDLRELDAEREALRAAGDELGKVFAESAIRHVRAQMEKAREEMDTEGLRRAEREVREALNAVSAAGKDNHPGESLTVSTDPTAVPVTEATISDAVPTTPNKPKNRRAHARAAYIPSTDPSYLYYQSSTGANIFLHPLDIKILLAYYKTYPAFPDTILVRPQGADEGSINDDLRRRCKYLAHLGTGTDVVFVEADLEETLGKDAVKPFEAALKMRRNRRRDRVKKEDKAKLRWEAAERDKMPFGVRGNPGTTTGTGEAEDEDFLLALQRSTEEMGPPPSTTHTHHRGSEASSPTTSSVLGTSFPPSSSSTDQTRIGISTSPSSSRTTSYGGAKSWASALHAPPGTRTAAPTRRDPEADWEMERAWLAFEESAAAAAAAQAEDLDGRHQHHHHHQQRQQRQHETTDNAGNTGEGGRPPGAGKKAKPKKLVLSMSSGGRRA
ncbi:hypothetical protein QFC19_001616 [Naganishia cerealis]|uniref:Uncharacterized protein n=1 Tax=Naganishia cerealis TaxID=610337 RepID=A0ACC2WH66_9TREE|nr:hypothetical protein QFC19_001616 [Naganishia cerealis]